MRKHLSTIFLIFIFITGLSLLLYPTVSDYWNSIFQSQAIAGYTQEVAQIDDDIYENLWEKAQDYNRSLLRGDERFIFYEEDKAEYEILKDKTMAAINKNLPPEFINRLSDVIVFTPLNKEEQRQITRLLGKNLDKRLEDLDIVVKCSDEALDYVTDVGYDKAMGARPLARAISTYLEQPLSIYLLEDKVVKGDFVRVELEDNELVFYKQDGDELVPVDKELAK